MAFDRALSRFQAMLASDPQLEAAVFSGTEDWIRLLRYKLVPHLAGDGCLIAAVAGGTNSGKSTVFNVLAGAVISPVCATAAATCRPVLAGNASRAALCLDAKLLPDFTPKALGESLDVFNREADARTMYVATTDSLPDRLVLLDTPDVDSIDQDNWLQAETIQAAGDIMVAVLTGEKYQDERVVAFFRRAAASGRIVIPLMNKADPSKDYEVARRQLDEFCKAIGVQGPRYAVPHDFSLGEHPEHSIQSLNGQPPLRDYLLGLDSAAIKERVYRDSIAYFSDQARAFLANARKTGQILAEASNELRQRADDYARRFDPAPGAEIGGLFHAFVQERRGPVRRYIGLVGSKAAVGLSSAGRFVRKALLRRATLEAGGEAPGEAELRAEHARVIERITRELARSYTDTARNLREPAAHLVQAGLERIDADAAVKGVVDEMFRTERLSEEFRDHARRMLEAWWNGHPARRRALEALDMMLAVTPLAIAAPMTVLTGGFGVAETVTITAGPFAEQFVARVAEYQFGDQLFDFLSPWRQERQEQLRQAIETHIAVPCLEELDAHLGAFTDGPLDEMDDLLASCRTP